MYSLFENFNAAGSSTFPVYLGQVGAVPGIMFPMVIFFQPLPEKLFNSSKDEFVLAGKGGTFVKHYEKALYLPFAADLNLVAKGLCPAWHRPIGTDPNGKSSRYRHTPSWATPF